MRVYDGRKPFLEYLPPPLYILASNRVSLSLFSIHFYFVSALLYIFLGRRFFFLAYVLYNTRFSLCGGLLLSSVCHRPGLYTQKRNFYSIFYSVRLYNLIRVERKIGSVCALPLSLSLFVTLWHLSCSPSCSSTWFKIYWDIFKMTKAEKKGVRVLSGQCFFLCYREEDDVCSGRRWKRIFSISFTIQEFRVVYLRVCVCGRGLLVSRRQDSFFLFFFFKWRSDLLFLDNPVIIGRTEVFIFLYIPW